MIREEWRRRWTLLAVFMLAGCAGGGETGTGAGGKNPLPTPIPTPPPDGHPDNFPAKKDLSIGAITALGSVWVNGVEFNTSTTTVTLDGVPVPVASLGIGMMAAIKGTIDADLVSGYADDIVVKKLVKGLVTAVDSLRFTVLRQTVQVDEATAFFDRDRLLDATQLTATVATLLTQPVDISGVIKSPGVIVATRVDVNTEMGLDQVSGEIANLNLTLKTFNVGNLQVSYSGVAQLPASTLLNGDVVEVRGRFDSSALVASSLERLTLAEPDANRIEMQGCVAGASPDFDSFGLNSVIVMIAANASYTGGRADQIVNGTCVEVEGTLAKGEVTAAHITLKNKARLESNVVSLGANTLALQGFDGLTVAVDRDTEYFSGISPANFAAIVLGHSVKVRGRYDPIARTLLATRIDIGNVVGKDIVIRNYVDALNPMPPAVTLMGVSLDIAVDPNSKKPEFTGGNVNTSASFFNTVMPGYVVELEGKIDNTGGVSWQLVNYED
ncbi:MAG: hypothetical protein HY273_12590 [Gammaproteobacteria bacterium]|nr:hypothetical protein [Gammaproteobacteria bacterium]